MKYPPDYIDRLEILWGEGFLSSGRAQEVSKILKGIDVRRKTILDIGCGTGGVEVLLVKAMGVGRVIGIDVEPELISRSKRRVIAANVSKKVEILLVEQGPLPFPDDSFDIVFSKESIAHIYDKSSLIEEIYRVLRPRGWFASSDWLADENAASSPAWRRLVEVTGFAIEVSSAKEIKDLMSQTGFVKVTSVNRCRWYASIAAKEVEQLEGPLRERVLEIVDEATFSGWLELRRALRDVVIEGVLGPLHVRGFKPE